MFGVLGTTTADLFIAGVQGMPCFDGDEFTTNSLSFCDRQLTMTVGGNGANSAYVLRSLGAEAALISGTGTNEIGQTVTNWLTASGVDLSAFARHENGTATNTTIIDDCLNRVSFYYPGIFPTFNDNDIPAIIWPRLHTLLITGLPLLPGFRPDGFRQVLEQAKAQDITTAVDIGPAIGQPATIAELRPLLPWIDLLITNDYELGIATGVDELFAGIELLVEAGAGCVVVKQGVDGAVYHKDGASEHIPGFAVDATVTVGAGDSFNAGLLFALHDGRSLAEAIRFANATASLVVQTGQSALGAPNTTEVNTFLQAQTIAG